MQHQLWTEACTRTGTACDCHGAAHSSMCEAGMKLEYPAWASRQLHWSERQLQQRSLACCLCWLCLKLLLQLLLLSLAWNLQSCMRHVQICIISCGCAVMPEILEVCAASQKLAHQAEHQAADDCSKPIFDWTSSGGTAYRLVSTTTS